MDFESNIVQWVQIDNKVRSLNKELQELREQRNNVLNILNTTVEENKMQDTLFQINDGSLKFQTTRIPQPLSLKFVKECLSECIPNTEDVDKLMDYIKTKRNYKEVHDIKRTFTQE